MKKLTIAVGKKLGYVCAGLIILAAILVGISRIYIPALDEHRTDFERMASDILNAPVTINKARFSWYRYQPEISLYDITLYDSKTRKSSLHLKRLRVFFSIPQSLLKRKLVFSGIMISGAEINIVQNKSGEFVVRDLPQLEEMTDAVEAGAEDTKATEMVGWLLTQPRLMLSDIDLHYEGFNGVKRYVTFNHLRFENNGNDHDVLARAVLHQDIPTEVSLVVKATGDVNDLNKLRVNAYVYFAGLSLSQWAKTLEWNGWTIEKGLGSAKIWFNWDNGSMQQVQSVFQVYELQLASAKTKNIHTINRLSADIGWRRNGSQQIIAADDVLLDMEDHIWPVTNLYVLLKPNRDNELAPKEIDFGYFNVADVAAFLSGLTEVMPLDTRDMINSLSPSGAISHARVVFPDNDTDWQMASVQAELASINIKPWKNIPGVNNLTGIITLDKNHGRAIINSKKLVLNDKSHFFEPLIFDQVAADVGIERQDGGWAAKLGSFHAANQDLSLDVSGYVKKKENKSPYMDMQASFQVNRLDRINTYLPIDMFKPGLKNWLKSAFISGYTRHGTAQIQGYLEQFPYIHGGGKFHASTDVKDVTLNYAPDWPVLNEINANISFTADNINIHVINSKMSGIDTGEVTATIPSLASPAPATLHATVKNITTDFVMAMRFVHHSPLNQTLGRMFKDLQVSGPITIGLDLTVPLSKPDDISLAGIINLNSVNVLLVPWNLKIANVTGLTHFTEKTTDSQPLQARLFGKPMTLTLKTINKNSKDAIIQATIATKLLIKDLQNWLNIPFSDVITGETNVNANVDLSLDDPVQVHIASDLQGAIVTLPMSYAKSASDKIKFTSDIILPEKQPMKLRIDYGEKLNLALTLNNLKGTFKLLGVTLRLGEGVAGWPAGDGLYITGGIPKLDMALIKSYLAKTNDPLIPGLDLKDINVDVKEIDLLGQSLDNVKVDVKPNRSSWDVTVLSDDVAGKITIPSVMNSSSVIMARFEKLDLDVDEKNAGLSDTFDMKSIPGIDFEADNVDINGMLLGQVAFNLIPSSSGMTIKSLAIASPNVNIKASGTWSVSGESSSTTLSGTLTSSNVSKFLHNMTYDIQNFVASTGNLKFDLSWPAAPFTPMLQRLSGDAVLEMGPGRIVDVGAENDAKMDLGRMLSIFSLQSIPRRLSLDFSDLVEKGYSFDSLRGSFRLSNGNVYTNNAKFEGLVASIGIAGRIGVEDKDVDLTLHVTPHVTASLPIAATIIGGPIAGIASLAVNSVVSAAVSTVATHQYNVKGKWSNPKWDTVEPEKPASAPVSNRRR